MYASIPLKRLLAVIAWTFGIVLLGYFSLVGWPHDLTEIFRKTSAAVTIWSFLLVLIFGPTSPRWSLWRLVWSWRPELNRLAFPDLNGVWKGSTCSNWPAIQRMLEAAKGSGNLDPETLATTDLQRDGITMTIKASLFSFRISAELESTGGMSHSLTERVSENKRRGELELFYIYLQETPEPALTDEGSHPGAASLTINLSDFSMNGEYWTKRSWRSGFNTAGRIEVKRLSR